MAKFFPPQAPADVIHQTFRFVDPQSLVSAMRAFFVSVPVASSSLYQVNVAGTGAGATWCVQAIGGRPLVTGDPGIPFPEADVAFRLATDDATNIDAQVAACISELAARHPNPQTLLIGDVLLCGAGDGHLWLVGVVGAFSGGT